MDGAIISFALDKAMIIYNVTRAARSFGLTVSEFIAFLRRPTVENLLEQPIGEKAEIGVSLFVLSIATTMIVGVLALPVILATDLTTGEKLSEALSGSIWSVLLSVVVLGPLIEEIIFRGWLSGTWRAVLASAFGLTTIYGGSAILDPYVAEGNAIQPLLIVAGAILIFLAFSPLDDARRIIGFERVFPVIFYAQATVFGFLHFQNYAASSLVIALLATLPLVACGLIWGYARIRLGFASAVILHAAYNVPAALGSIIVIQFAV